MASRWDYRKWGTADDPIHKSQLNAIAGDYGCLRRMRYERDQLAVEGAREPKPFVPGKQALGLAAHETIAQALSEPAVCAAILEGRQLLAGTVARELRAELDSTTDGRELVWYGKDNPEKLFIETAAMIDGLLADLHNHVAAVVLVEAGYIAKLGNYWVSGHVDMVYRPKSDANSLAFCDWKTGAQLPHQIELDHGFESGLYSHALQSGVFVPRDRLTFEQVSEGWRAEGPFGDVATHKHRHEAERMCLDATLITVARRLESSESTEWLADFVTFGDFPSDIRHVHLRDYVPYSRKGTKKVERPEQLVHYGLDAPAKVTYQLGEVRGPAWYRMRRTEHDVPRLLHLVRSVVGVVRMGRFFERIGEKCTRCSFRDDCLTAGYAPAGAEKKQLEQGLGRLEDDFDGLGDVA